MTEIQLFGDGEFDLTAECRGDSFIVHAPGLARGLSYRDAANMLRNLPEEERGTHNVSTPGGNQRVSFVTEPGLYRILASRRPGAIKNQAVRVVVERFQNWLFREVLPALRRGEDPSAAEDGNPYNAFTYDEVNALLRQRYGLVFTVPSLTRMLRTAGVLKQNGSPTKKYEYLFWFTGSHWTVHRYAVAILAGRVTHVTRQLGEFQAIQTRLQIEGMRTTPARLEIDGDAL